MIDYLMHNRFVRDGISILIIMALVSTLFAGAIVVSNELRLYKAQLRLHNCIFAVLLCQSHQHEQTCDAVKSKIVNIQRDIKYLQKRGAEINPKVLAAIDDFEKEHKTP